MVYVFKTSVKTKKEVSHLTPGLNAFLKKSQWNFDLDDCDKILRIDSPTEIVEAVIKFLRAKDFECNELSD